MLIGYAIMVSDSCGTNSIRFGCDGRSLDLSSALADVRRSSRRFGALKYTIVELHSLPDSVAAELAVASINLNTEGEPK